MIIIWKSPFKKFEKVFNIFSDEFSARWMLGRQLFKIPIVKRKAWYDSHAVTNTSWVLLSSLNWCRSVDVTFTPRICDFETAYTYTNIYKSLTCLSFLVSARNIFQFREGSRILTTSSFKPCRY